MFGIWKSCRVCDMMCSGFCIKRRQMMKNKKKYAGFYMGIMFALMLIVTGCGGEKVSDGHKNDGAKLAETKEELEVHFIDVGQGDSTLIKSGDHAMLIDAGENEKGVEVKEYLESQHVEKLDYIIGTHPDSDHIGGMDVAIDAFDSEKIFMPDLEKDTKTYMEVIDSAEEKQEEIIEPKVGDNYSLGEAEFTVVSPNSTDYNSSNDYSIGILLEHGENKFLFVGDAEEKSEEEMVENDIDLDADVYKVSHHGSSTGTSEEFLQAVSPEYAVISCGEGNSYGHPHAEVLNELRAEDVKVFRTDEQGTIVATSDGEKIEWNMSSSKDWASGEPTGNVKEKEEDDMLTGVQTYILNTNTKKYHLPDCNSVNSIKKKNKEERKGTEEELEKEGYSPCQNCIGN